MRKLFFISVFLLVSSLVLAQAPTPLTHNTGPLTFSIFDNSFIGHLNDGSGGNGIKFKTAVDAMYTGGFVAGYSNTKTVGVIGSFTINDMVITTPFGAFSSNTFFNQVSNSVFNDNNAPATNKVGITVNQRSLSNAGDSMAFVEYKVTNTSGAAISQFYVGVFADWDVGLDLYAQNRGGYAAANNLAYQYLNNPLDPNYYGIVALSGMSGARVTTQPTGATLIRDSTFRFLSTFLNESTPGTANGDYRMWIGSGPYSIANNASITVGFAFVAGSNLAMLQANSSAAQIKWNNQILPVELSAFSAVPTSGNNVIVNWTTATEINNRGFEIQRSFNNSDFITIAFVEGKGTTTETQNYSYTDASLTAGKYSYRLRQFDFDGRFETFNAVEVDINAPLHFNLAQNYPNPFNPSTKISFAVSQEGVVKLSIFNMIGEEIQTLVNESKAPGNYDITFDASSLTSGAYFYKIQSGSNTQIKKMLLLK
jgi:hypothetical protein